MRYNGLMIDCSRLMERHDYYFRLLDFMAEWGMNLLVLHFADDHGLAVRLPGFSEIAVERALTAAEVRKLQAHARRRGIEVVPELETFGHTRYLTDKPRYGHLYAGRKHRKLTFNAVDPLHPETLRVMRRLMRATARLFDSPNIHIGCDEVNLADYCRERGGLDEAETWVGHVNRMIALARECGKTPLLWADHLLHDPRIAAGVDKAAVPVIWNYWDVNGRDPGIGVLKRAGFERLWVAPSVGCHLCRFLPSRRALGNVAHLARCGRRFGAEALLNTVWCPYYYVQGAIYYGIAYSAEACRAGGRIPLKPFHEKFARKVFGVGLSRPLAKFLAGYGKVDIDNATAAKIIYSRRLSGEQWRHLEVASAAGKAILPLAEQIHVRRNEDIWRAMVVAARAAWVCAENLLLRRRRGSAARRLACNRTLRQARREVADEWDRTRYPDDPRKTRTAFPNEQDAYALILLRRLKYLEGADAR